MMNYYHGSSRCEALGRYIVANNATVRETAREFGIGKSTVHKDVTVYLEARDAALFEAVASILQKNKSERHLRGGEATRQKYKSREQDGKTT